MAKGKGLAIGLGLVAVVGVGALAMTAKREDEDEASSGGMVLSDGCNTVTVEDPGAFMEAWVDFMIGLGDELELVEFNEPNDVGELLVVFLDSHFPDCFGDAFPGEEFQWVTTVPAVQTRTFDQVVADLMSVYELIPPGFEGDPADAPLDIEAAGQRLANSMVIVDPFPLPPVPTPDPPDPAVPLPPIPPLEGEGEPEGPAWEVIPENVVQAITPEHMTNAGVERSMEPQGAISLQPEAVFVVYDPEYPQLGILLDALYDLARDYPDTVFITASMWDTQQAFGKPAMLGGLGYAVNAANRNGKFLHDDGALAADMDQGPLNAARWEELANWSGSPYQAKLATAT